MSTSATSSQPRWRRDGAELFYLTGVPNPTGSVMSVTVEATSAGLRFGIPQRLFDSYAIQAAHTAGTFSYAVAPDGKRFLVARQIAAANSNPAESPLTVVLNWTSMLPSR